MRATKKAEVANPVAVDMAEFQRVMGCGYVTARRISEEAGARVRIGKRVLINLAKVQTYLDTIAE